MQLTTFANGIAERWVGSCRREILDHVIALNEQHLRRLIRDYVNYYHEDRIHDSLEKDTPNRLLRKRRFNPARIDTPQLLAFEIGQPYRALAHANRVTAWSGKLLDYLVRCRVYAG